MSELDIEVPLAKTEDITDFGDFQCSQDIQNSNTNSLSTTCAAIDNRPQRDNNCFVDNNFADTFSDSLEDLVNTFDEKITKCFRNYDENVEKLAPVQVRTQEEIMNECQYVCIIFSCRIYITCIKFCEH